MRRQAWLMMFLAVTILGPSSSWADRLGIHEQAESLHYRTKMIGMLGRGLLNMGTGYVDVLARTIDGTMEGPIGLGTARGIGWGLACGVLRTVSGAVDWATFWVPGFNGAPVSASYHNCLADRPEPIL